MPQRACNSCGLPLRYTHSLSLISSRPLSQSNTENTDSETQPKDDDQSSVLALSLDVNVDVSRFLSQCRARSASSTPQARNLSPMATEHARQLKTVKKDYLVELIMDIYSLRVDFHVLTPMGQNEAQPNVVLQFVDTETPSASNRKGTPAPETPLAQTATSAPTPSSSHLTVPNHQRGKLPTPSRTASPSTPTALSADPATFVTLGRTLPSSLASPTPAPSQTIPTNSMSKRRPFPPAGVSAPQLDMHTIVEQSTQGRRKSSIQSTSSIPTSGQASATTSTTQARTRQKRKTPGSDTSTAVIPASAGQPQPQMMPQTHMVPIQSYAPSNSNMTIGMAQNAVAPFYGMQPPPQQQQYMSPHMNVVSHQFLVPPEDQAHMLGPAFEGPPQKRQRYDPNQQYFNYGGPSSS